MLCIVCIDWDFKSKHAGKSRGSSEWPRQTQSNPRSKRRESNCTREASSSSNITQQHPNTCFSFINVKIATSPYPISLLRLPHPLPTLGSGLIVLRVIQCAWTIKNKEILCSRCWIVQIYHLSNPRLSTNNRNTQSLQLGKTSGRFKRLTLRTLRACFLWPSWSLKWTND